MTSAHRDFAQVLLQVPIFAGFSPAEMETLAAHTRHRTYTAGAVIFQQDEVGICFHLIQRGLVKVYLSSEEGRDLILAILQPSEFFGELSLIDGMPRSASAAALEPTETLEIGREDFLRVLEKHPLAAHSICAVLAGRLRRSDGIIGDSAFLDIRARVARRLLELADRFGKQVDGQVLLEMRLRQSDLAGLVGTTRETINRVMSALEGEGYLRFERGRVTLVRADRLAHLAGVAWQLPITRPGGPGSVPAARPTPGGVFRYR